MRKKIFLMIVLLCCFTVTTFAASAKTNTGLTEINTLKIWPLKANWVGQRATFFMPKIYAKVSYLLIYADPLTPITGMDQKSLARKIANNKFIIKGLYELQQGNKTEYYWYLASESGGPAVWVKDYAYKPLAELPFSLPEEIEKENKDNESLQSLVGTVVWYNRNTALVGNEAENLEALTVASIVSDGPFSDTYSIKFKRDDDTLIEWKGGFTTNPPVYTHADLGKIFTMSFYAKSPYQTYPNWKQQDWIMISHREVCKGWTKDKVMLSWGKPNQIEKPGSHEQWIYNEKEDKVIFFFDEDKITKILVPKQVKAVVGVPLKKANKYNDNAKPVTDKKNPKTKDEFENYQEVVGVVK